MMNRILFFLVPYLCFCAATLPAQSLSAIRSQALLWDSVVYCDQQKDYKSVLILLSKLKRLDSSNPRYPHFRGQIFITLGKYDSAILEFSNAIMHNPQNVDLFLRRGYCFYEIQKFDQSIVDFTQGLAISKYRYQDSLLYRHRAVSSWKNEDYGQAIVDCDSALKYNPLDKQLFQIRAQCKLMTNNVSGALDDMGQALRIDPSYQDALKGRVLIYATIKRLDLAYELAVKYLALNPQDEQMLLLISSVLVEKQEFKKALFYLDRTNQKDKAYFLLRGTANYYLANDNEAILDLAKVLDLNPILEEEQLVYYMTGVCQNNVKEKSGCATIQKAIKKGMTDAIKTYESDCN